MCILCFRFRVDQFRTPLFVSLRMSFGRVVVRFHRTFSSAVTAGRQSKL